MTDLAWNAARADEDSQPEHAEAGSGSGPFFAIFGALEAAGIDYCVSHGAEEFPWPQGSDIDIVVQRGVSDERLEAAVRQACDGKSVILGAKSGVRSRSRSVTPAAPRASCTSISLVTARRRDVSYSMARQCLPASAV